MKLIKVIFIGFLLLPVSLRADLNGTLDSMFDGIVINPSLSENSRQKVLSLGAVRLRSGQKKYNIVSFNPPRMNAGCGGIDLYGGSFSFINAEEFRALIRQIGSQALGYAFQLAMEELCPKCTEVIKNLQQKVAEINALMSDTCRWAKGIVHESGIQGAIRTIRQDSKERLAEDGGNDVFGAFQELWTWPGLATNNKEKCDQNTEECKDKNSKSNNDVGNRLAKALAKAAKSNGAVMEGMSAGDLNNIILNILGMRIIKSEADDAPVIGDEKLPTITFSDLKRGGLNRFGEGIHKKVYQCNKESFAEFQAEVCDDPQIDADWTFLGTEEYAYDMLLGKKEGNDRRKESSDNNLAIVYQINQDVNGLSPRQMRFIQAIEGLVMEPLMYAQSSEASLRETAFQIAPIYSRIMQVKLGEAILESMNNIFKESKELKLTDKQLDAYYKFVKDLEAAKDGGVVSKDEMIMLIDFAKKSGGR